MWFELKGDARLGRCTSDGCGGQPTMRLEASGVGSDYCSGCALEISRIAIKENRRARAMIDDELPGYTQYTGYRP